MTWLLLNHHKQRPKSDVIVPLAQMRKCGCRSAPNHSPHRATGPPVGAGPVPPFLLSPASLLWLPAEKGFLHLLKCPQPTSWAAALMVLRVAGQGLPSQAPVPRSPWLRPLSRAVRPREWKPRLQKHLFSWGQMIKCRHCWRPCPRLLSGVERVN